MKKQYCTPDVFVVFPAEPDILTLSTIDTVYDGENNGGGASWGTDIFF